MTFADFSKHLSKIEATPKRLEITDLLSGLIKQTGSEEVEKAVNLSLGQLTPLYKDVNFGMAEKMMIKAVARATDEEETKVTGEFKIFGDLGQTVYNLKNQKILQSRIPLRPVPDGTGGTKLSVTEVFDSLLNIAQDSGENSQDRKIDKTAALLRKLNPISAKYAVRIILGNLRLGFSDRTVLDALSNIVAGDKSARKKLEEVYNVRPDIGWMASQIRNSKFEIRNFTTNPQLGTPILPALCQRLEGTEEIIEKMCRLSGRASSIEESGGRVAVEPKWDGQRIQAHAWIQGTRETNIEVKLFTRGLEDVTNMFPDLVAVLKTINNRQLTINNCILDGEVVGFDPKTDKILPFQTMITRKRKYGISQQLLNVPIRYMVFDIMYLNGKSLMQEPFSKRRETLKRILSRYRSSVIGSRSQVNRFSVSRSETDRPKTDKHVTDNRKPITDNRDILNLAHQLVTDNPVKIRDFLKRQIDSGLEGIVAKRFDSPYSPGRTGFSWVKLKWEGKANSGGLIDTVDCVVMGTYAGQGKRAGFGVGAFLVGVLNTEYRIPNNKKKQTTAHSVFSIQNSVFVTISKIGTGLTDEQWKELKIKSSKLKVKNQPKEYDVPKALAPDVWITPKIVVEIQADNLTISPLHTAGFALRFPRLVRYRDDKSPEQTTTLKEIKRLYKLQN